MLKTYFQPRYILILAIKPDCDRGQGAAPKQIASPAKRVVIWGEEQGSGVKLSALAGSGTKRTLRRTG